MNHTIFPEQEILYRIPPPPKRLARRCGHPANHQPKQTPDETHLTAELQIQPQNLLDTDNDSPRPKRSTRA